jgi:hypothetical protein
MTRVGQQLTRVMKKTKHSYSCAKSSHTTVVIKAELDTRAPKVVDKTGDQQW